MRGAEEGRGWIHDGLVCAMYCSSVSGGSLPLYSTICLCGVVWKSLRSATKKGREPPSFPCSSARETERKRARENQPPNNNNVQINTLYPSSRRSRTLLYITRLYIKSSSRSVVQERPACILQRPIAHEPLSVLPGQFASRYNPGFVSYMSTYETDAA